MKLLLLAAFLACGNRAFAQLPNEKFGKPSSLEWEFNGWGEAIKADAIVLCKTMKVTYQISDQVSNFNRNSSEISTDNISDFGKNQIDDSNTLVKYEFRLRTKILKPEGAGHANIDITYFNSDDNRVFDELSNLKVRVFTKNAKGKVERRNVSTDSFVREPVDENYTVIHVAVPDVEPGSIIEYQYDITSSRPSFLYDWVFQESIPMFHAKCDIDIPAFLQFNMNVPINKLIKSGVVVGRLAYDTNRPDLKKGKTCPTNHYTISGDYILPADQAPDIIAPFTSKINMPHVTLPAYMPEGHTHLKIQ
ncbi:MAG: DUF3857 domain-containing protein [Prevotella sp.]|nr:DUF3857 domain-containing protein [Prevotella sp.]